MKIHSIQWKILIMLLFVLSACKNDGENISHELISSQTIFGEDDRVRLFRDINAQSRKTGLLVGETSPGYIKKCSAVSVGKRYLLSAAHCLYWKDSSGDVHQVQNLYFYPGIKDADTQPYGRFAVTNAYLPVHYVPLSVAKRDLAKDIAVLEVANNAEGYDLTRQVGTNGYWGARSLPSREVMSIGYPGDKDYAHAYIQRGCEFEEYDEFLLTSTCDVYSGQSGSPVFTRYNGNYYVTSVISAQTEKYNYFTRITPERQKMIDSIVQGKFEEDRLSFTEAWDMTRIYLEQRLRVFIKNECSNKSDLYTAYLAKNDQNEWPTKGYYLIPYGKTYELTSTKNALYRLHVHNHQGRTLIGKSAYSHRVNTNNEIAHFDEFKIGRYGDVVHTLRNCQ